MPTKESGFFILCHKVNISLRWDTERELGHTPAIRYSKISVVDDVHPNKHISTPRTTTSNTQFWDCYLIG